MCKVRLIQAKDALSVEQVFSLAQELFKNQNNVKISVTGKSMHPFLHDAVNKIEFSPGNFQTIKPSDIVLVKRTNGQYVIHRVIRKEEDCFFINGDAQQWIEGPLNPEQVVACAKSVFRRDKWIPCENFWWRFLSKIWFLLLPYRYFLFRIYRLIKQVVC